MSSSKSNRIALLTSSFLPDLGGAEVGLHNIAIRLLERGYEPIVIVPYSIFKRLKKENWNLPYEVRPVLPKTYALLKIWPKFGLFVIDKIFAWFQTVYQFDFWHVTMGYPTGVAMVNFAQSYPEVHYLIRCAGEDIQCNTDIGYGVRLDSSVDYLFRDLLPKADHLIAISESVANEYRALNIKESQINYIPNGVDIERFSDTSARNNVRKLLGIRDEEIIFLSVGRNHKKKNFNILVDAAKLMRDNKELNFRIFVVGAGSPKLLSLARERGVADLFLVKEHMKPDPKTKSLQLPTDELLNFYMAADVFVFPSLIETFGIVLVEAMAARLPIITTNAPGCRDIIRGGRDGSMLPVGDITALVKEMIKFLHSSTIRAEMSERSWQRAQDFSWDHVVDLYVEVYQSYLNQKI